VHKKYNVDDVSAAPAVNSDGEIVENHAKHGLHLFWQNVDNNYFVPNF